MDYGHDGKDKYSLRAFKNHQIQDPLKDLGSADITADVDFQYLRRKCKLSDVAFFGPVGQGHFLRNLGMELRKDQLVKHYEHQEQAKKQIEDSFRVLTSSSEMGERFKVCCVFPKTMKVIHDQYPPTGFTNNEE